MAVALGTQEILKQFLASLVLCNPESPLSVGDYVRIMGTEGAVTNVSSPSCCCCCCCHKC